MELSVAWRCSRAAVIEIDDGGLFTTSRTWDVYVNDEPQGTTDRIETYVDGLVPGERNVVRLVAGDEVMEIGVTCPAESFTLDVRDFGARGDGSHDDTCAIQAAIMACPAAGRVLVPEGRYLVKSLFLKSGVSIELAEGSVLLARHDRESLAYLPGTLEGAPGSGHAGSGLLPLGTWEGESRSTYCSLITGLGVSDVAIYGRGVLDGQAAAEEGNWWHDPKNIYRPEVGCEVARPRLVFLSECAGVSLVGFTVRNSPAWNIHPVLCRGLGAYALTIEGPKDSPNTDGFDPESCSDVVVKGCHFSVGDDCMAIKSGKLDMPRVLRPATHDMLVEHCYMHDGHGSVVIGSEAAGGVKDLVVRKCLFERTDRGLRVKTRRGRGADAVNEGITFEHIRMNEVLVPFVVNSFYFCDKDGKTDYVQCREALPVDERTPRVGSLTFEDIDARGCHAAAAYITGLPESKIDRLTFRDVHVDFSPDARPFVPAMACGVEEMVRQGLVVEHVRTLELDNVDVEGQDGELLALSDVDRVDERATEGGARR